MQPLMIEFVLPVVIGLILLIAPFLVPKLKSTSLALRWTVAIVLSIAGGGIAYYFGSGHVAETASTVAGVVVDESTNAGLGGAEISVVGRTETAVSEDTGNFALKLHATTEPTEAVRLHIRKQGYSIADISVIPPYHDLIVQLKRQSR